VTYSYNSVPVVVTIVADASGNVIITGLAAGIYANIAVSSFGCLSDAVGPVTMMDPMPAPPPVLTSNAPLCPGKTLQLHAAVVVDDLTFDWSGPAGFSAHTQDASVPEITADNAGDYTLTTRYRNCASSSTISITEYPGITLTNVTPDTLIPLGSSVHLHASGAYYYVWGPNDATLDNPYLDTPTATPTETKIYVVRGMSINGCRDSATVTITVDNNINEFIPSAFSPNGDGYNDVFRIGNMKYDKLIEFSIYNRWGQRVYYNSHHPEEGWDGTFHGTHQDVGVYTYYITVENPQHKLKYFKGDVTLVR
jgi:gliding motility-associated-like protein